MSLRRVHAISYVVNHWRRSTATSAARGSAPVVLGAGSVRSRDTIRATPRDVEREDLCGRKLGEFVVRERLGEGGFGAVYRCEQPLLGRDAVIKVLHRRLRRDDDVLLRFRREAQLGSRLDHPYAAHVYAFGIEHDDGLLWIAMEKVEGITLDRWLRDRGPWPLEQFLPWFACVAEVVQTAHDRGIVHRDLKPSNVMVLERAGRLLPKLLDFGIAKQLDDTATESGACPPRAHVEDDPRCGVPRRLVVAPSCESTLPGTTDRSPRGLPCTRTLTGTPFGSPPYMSPEQWNDASAVGPGADLYALGVLAYEALTGRRPFTARTRAGYAALHRSTDVPSLGDGFSSALDGFFRRALAKRCEDRWPTAMDLAAAFRAASRAGSVR